MKSNALVQAPILRLLSQLLELNVTYSILDSKNVIFDQILSNIAGDYVYMKLYNILRGANDSYKVSQATDSRIQSEQPPLSRWWRRNGKSCAARALRFASNPATQHPSIEHPGFSFR